MLLLLAALATAGAPLILCNDPRYAVTEDRTGRIAESVARVQPRTGLELPVTACTTYPPGLAYRAGQVWQDAGGGNRAMLVFVGPDLRDSLTDDELDAVVGHELAHEALRLECDRQPNDNCELAVDFLSVHWVGYDSTLSAMRVGMHDASERARAGFTRRIAGLERLRLLAPVREPIVENAELTRVADGIMRAARLPFDEVIVLTPPSWRTKGIVNAMTNIVRKRYLVIRVSPILVEEMDAEAMRGLLAHELAHPQSQCMPDPVTHAYGSDGEALACEHRADAVSARWVGKRAALRGLCQLMAIGWDWRYTTDVSHLMDRIRLLHAASETK